MSLSAADERELLLPLHAGEGTPPGAAFLERLRRRLRARAMLLVRRTARSGWDAVRSGAADGGVDRPVLLAMRPGRVYALDEIAADAGAGRAVRSGGDGADQWLVALDEADRFTAGNTSLLANLAPHVAIAAANTARLAAAQAAHAAAEAALARAGVGWALLDADGARIAGGAVPAAARARRALAAATAGGEAMAVAEAAIALPPPAGAGDAACVALFRRPVSPIDRARAFAAAHGVPVGEARLAVALADGTTLAEAAVALGYTRETARFYSKRLFAATGTRGQPDLVRLVWTGTAALA